jgi:hypothetical protein
MLDYYQAAISAIALTVNVAVQLLAARAHPQRGYLRSVFTGFGAGLIGLFALAGLAYYYQSTPWQDAAALLFVNTATYAALSYCFFAGFVNLGKTSLRIRLFRELQRSGCGLSMEQILSLYNHRRLIELRLERLLRSKQVVKRDGRYFLGGFLLWLIATAVRLAKLLVIGKDSEFSGAEEVGHPVQARTG